MGWNPTPHFCLAFAVWYTDSSGIQPVVGNIESWFDLNHDLWHIMITIQVPKIRFDSLRLEIRFDLLSLEIQFGPNWFGYKSRSDAKLFLWLQWPIPTKFGMRAAPHDVIKIYNFCNKILRGFRSTGGQNPRFPIYFAGRRYNSAALLCSVW